jgi:hypothetical protein
MSIGIQFGEVHTGLDKVRASVEASSRQLEEFGFYGAHSGELSADPKLLTLVNICTMQKNALLDLLDYLRERENDPS